VAAALMRDKQAALDTLAREELGIDPAEMGGNPWTAAGFSFALFRPRSDLPGAAVPADDRNGGDRSEHRR